jgi:hypothetical protein
LPAKGDRIRKPTRFEWQWIAAERFFADFPHTDAQKDNARRLACGRSSLIGIHFGIASQALMGIF